MKKSNVTTSIRIDDAAYEELLQTAVSQIRTARSLVATQVNSTAHSMYWNLGKLLFEKQLEEGYGSGVVVGEPGGEVPSVVAGERPAKSDAGTNADGVRLGRVAFDQEGAPPSQDRDRRGGDQYPRPDRRRPPHRSAFTQHRCGWR